MVIAAFETYDHKNIFNEVLNPSFDATLQIITSVLYDHSTNTNLFFAF